nr:zinc finger protein 90 homolog [Rhipicephalus microplus]
MRATAGIVGLPVSDEERALLEAMAGRKRGPHFKNPNKPRRKNSRVSVVDRARIVDVYRRGEDEHSSCPATLEDGESQQRQSLCSSIGVSETEGPSDVKVQKKAHTGRQLYECHLCPRSFKRSGLLKKHLCAHTGEQPYQCPSCVILLEPFVNLLHNEDLNTFKTWCLLLWYTHHMQKQFSFTEEGHSSCTATLEDGESQKRQSHSSSTGVCKTGRLYDMGNRREAHSVVEAIPPCRPCCAVGCQRAQSRENTVSFFKFAKEPAKGKALEINVHRKDWCASDTSVLYSAHFTADRYNDDQCLLGEFDLQCHMFSSDTGLKGLWHIRKEGSMKFATTPSSLYVQKFSPEVLSEEGCSSWPAALENGDAQWRQPHRSSIGISETEQLSYVKVHCKVHTGNPLFECHLCPQSFQQQGSLKRHLRTHTDERPYQCSVCSQSFSWQGDLSDHQRVHTHERPYNCHLCPRAFWWRSKLKAHLRMHTGH